MRDRVHLLCTRSLDHELLHLACHSVVMAIPLLVASATSHTTSRIETSPNVSSPLARLCDIARFSSRPNGGRHDLRHLQVPAGRLKRMDTHREVSRFR